jgi:ABC-type sugar transport system ATPase subunit
MTDPLLDISHLAKAYAGVPALRLASLDVAGGEVHALMGENGAGKSTLIRILAGATHADQGTITIDGKTVTIASPADAAHHGLRFIHQELSVVPHLSVAENIFLGRPYPLWLGFLADWRQLNKRAREALAQLSIDHIDPAIKMARLSTGDQMLVKIAAAFLDEGGENARLYVMDEPTAALTDAESARLFAVIARIKAKGRAILYVSHRMDEVMRIADRVTVMRDGATIVTLGIGDTSRGEIIALMTGRALGEDFPADHQAPMGAVRLSARAIAGGPVKDLSFELHGGEILGIAGLAGAGQSEVLQLLMGAIPLTSGTITLSGRALRADEPAGRWAEGMAYVPRERRREGLLPTASITDNTVLPHLGNLGRGRIFRHRAREAARASELAAHVRLKYSAPSQPVYQLSGGNQQKVVFARAMLANPQVLLLDEPTRGVDVGAKFDIHSLLRQLTATGAAIMLASSDLPELIGMSDRILVMRNGRLERILAAKGLSQQALLSMIFGETGEDAAAHVVQG